MKQITSLGIIIFLAIVAVNLVFSLFSLWSKKDVLTQTKNKLIQEQQEHALLKQKLVQVKSPLFIEEEARNKLFLAQPGESIILFPVATPSGQANSAQRGNKPIWQQWIELFF